MGDEAKILAVKGNQVVLSGKCLSAEVGDIFVVRSVTGAALATVTVTVGGNFPIGEVGRGTILSEAGLLEMECEREHDG